MNRISRGPERAKLSPVHRRGAVKDLLPHGPHNVRDVLATFILKQTGSCEQVSYAIQDMADMVAKHYGRLLPQDKAALAARILNQVFARTRAGNYFRCDLPSRAHGGGNLFSTHGRSCSGFGSMIDVMTG